jgi:carboxymethylenebutenolidase
MSRITGRIVAAGVVGFFVLAGLWIIFQTWAQAPKPNPQQRSLAPFLDEFRASKSVRIDTCTVTIPSAVGNVSGYLARPANGERLPAILLLFGKPGSTEWMKLSARELAGVGYVVLAVGSREKKAATSATVQTGYPALADEATLAEHSSAVRWLRRRADVFPDRLGVVGWATGGEQALALAASVPLQACVACDCRVDADSVLIAGLRWTPVLGIFSTPDEKPLSALTGFRKALTAGGTIHRIRVYGRVQRGFMGPPDHQAYNLDAAEEAWVEIYEFLGKYVEDAAENNPFPRAGERAPQARKGIATIADLMRSINGPEGVRAALVESLRKEPENGRQWDQVRARAALIAETGRLLGTLTPRKGGRAHWHDSATAFTTAAQAMVAAADRHSYSGIQKNLKDLAASCATCHNRHR